MLIRNAVSLGVSAALLLCYGSPGFAQSAPAAPAASDDGTLQEVVITAQKRTEKLQDITVSAAVVSQQALSDADIADISDINKLVPSVELNGTINGRVPTGIRGVSTVSNEGTVGISSGVAIAIDGVVVPSDSFAANNVAGIQSVEVLMGPQSTLGGRTAATGLINLTTRGPSDTFKGSLTGTVTTDNERHIEGFVSGPLGSRIDGSVDAFDYRTTYPIDNILTGQDSYVDAAGVRAKLKFKVTENFDVSLMGHLENTEGTGMNFVYTYLSPGACLLTCGPPPPNTFAFLTAPVLLDGIIPSNSNLKYDSPVKSGEQHRDTDYTLTLDYRLPAGITASSITAYQFESQNQVQDLFTVCCYFFNELTGGHGNFPNEQQQINTVKTVSEELKLVSAPDQPVTWIAGLYYQDVQINELSQRLGLPPATLDDIVEPDTATYDIYGHATWKLADDTSLVTGLRYNHDVLKLYYNQLATYPYFSPILAQPTGGTSNAVVGDIALRQKFAPDVMGYVSYSRGYSPQAYNTTQLLVPPTPATSTTPAIPGNNLVNPVGQEHIDSFEIGTKGSYLNHTLTFNADAFYTVYHDYQIQSFNYTPGVINPPLTLSSAGKASTKGVEANIDWLATRTTELSASATYAVAKFDTYVGAPCYSGQTPAEGCIVASDGAQAQDLSGDAMPNAPKFKFNVTAEQRFPVADYWQLLGRANYTYRTSAQMLPDQNPYAIQSAFGILNLSLALRSTDSKYDVSLFMNNVTNHVYYTDIEDFWSGPWGANYIHPNIASIANVGQPARDAHRYSGLKFTVNF